MNSSPPVTDLRQPTCTEALSQDMQSYLRQRVRMATSDAAQRCDIRLYQCLGDERSAEALYEDLIDFAAEPQHDHPAAGLVAVFECPPGAPEQEFAPALWRHLQLMSDIDDGLNIVGRSSGTAPQEDEVRLRVREQDFRLVVMHAQAERLTRVMPCPVLIFQPRA
ncbi:MAG: YqcI/YcgG family protein [Burkholderiaceae bacterium]